MKKGKEEETSWFLITTIIMGSALALTITSAFVSVLSKIMYSGYTLNWIKKVLDKRIVSVNISDQTCSNWLSAIGIAFSSLYRWALQGKPSPSFWHGQKWDDHIVSSFSFWHGQKWDDHIVSSFSFWHGQKWDDHIVSSFSFWHGQKWDDHIVSSFSFWHGQKWDDHIVSMALFPNISLSQSKRVLPQKWAQQHSFSTTLHFSQSVWYVWFFSAFINTSKSRNQHA